MRYSVQLAFTHCTRLQHTAELILTEPHRPPTVEASAPAQGDTAGTNHRRILTWTAWTMFVSDSKSWNSERSTCNCIPKPWKRRVAQLDDCAGGASPGECRLWQPSGLLWCSPGRSRRRPFIVAPAMS